MHVKAFMAIKNDNPTEEMCTSKQNELKSSYTQKLFHIAVKTSHPKILSDIISDDLKSISVPRQLRNINLKDLKQKDYDADDLSLLARNEKLQMINDIVVHKTLSKELN